MFEISCNLNICCKSAGCLTCNDHTLVISLTVCAPHLSLICHCNTNMLYRYSLWFSVPTINVPTVCAAERFLLQWGLPALSCADCTLTLLSMTLMDTLSAHTWPSSLSFVHKHWHVSLPILSFLSAVHVEGSHQTSASSLHWSRLCSSNVNYTISFPFLQATATLSVVVR